MQFSGRRGHERATGDSWRQVVRFLVPVFGFFAIGGKAFQPGFVAFAGEVGGVRDFFRRFFLPGDVFAVVFFQHVFDAVMVQRGEHGLRFRHTCFRRMSEEFNAAFARVRGGGFVECRYV